MRKQYKQIEIAIADDHSIVREGLCELINRFLNCNVMLEASNGAQLIKNLKETNLPDIAILDLNMPGMDGYETAKILSRKYPQIRIIILTIYEVKLTLIELLKLGVRGIITKNSFGSELKEAINYIMEDDTNYYYSNPIIRNMAKLFLQNNGHSDIEKYNLNKQEFEFLKLTPLDLTYKEIAEKMEINGRSIETLRQNMFLKFNVKSRAGLAIIAFQNGLIHF